MRYVLYSIRNGFVMPDGYFTPEYPDAFTTDSVVEANKRGRIASLAFPDVDIYVIAHYGLESERIGTIWTNGKGN